MVSYAPSLLRCTAETTLLFLPLIALMVAGVTTWVLRNRAARTQWAVGAGFAILTWLITMALSSSLPARSSFSVWQPERLFQSPLSFSLDQTSWAYMYASTTVLLAMVLTAATRRYAAPAEVRAFWFIFTALTLIALLAANLVTLTISWALMDFLTLLFFLRYATRPEDVQRTLVRTGIDMTGLLVLLAGASMNYQAGGDTSITTAFVSNTGVLLVILASLIRLGILPLHYGIPTFEPLRRGMGTLLRLFPPAVSLVLLTRLFELDIASQTRTWIMLAGGLGVFIGGVRWVLEDDVIESRPFFVLTISSLAVLIGASGAGGDGTRAAGVAMLLVGATLSLTEIHTPAQRIWPLLGSLLLLGLPWSIGGVVASSLGGMLGIGSWLPPVIVGGIGMVLLGLGSLHAVLEEEIPWPSAETLVRTMFTMGLALPILVGLGLGLWLQTAPGVEGLSIFGLAVILAALVFVVLRRVPPDVVRRWQSGISRVDPRGVYRVLWRPVKTLGRIARMSGGVFEGEGALLWMAVVVLFLILALGAG